MIATAVPRVVIKVGTSTLTDAAGRIDPVFIADLARQVAAVAAQGAQPVIVTSAAISAGLERMGFSERPKDIPSLQAAAAVGSVALAEAYSKAFEAEGIVTAQVLLTRNDTINRESYLHARDTFDRLLALGVVPIVNENDTVAVEEIRFGDNDTLAALVAGLIGASMVILLSDIDGFYDMDPRDNADAHLLEEVAELTSDLVCAAGGAGSAMGSGGMATKVEAARILMKAGVRTVICDGRRENVVLDAWEGRPVGTVFVEGSGATSARKLWIALAHRPKGSITIDSGAVAALRDQGRSLLPVGVVDVEGDFGCGDAVVLRDSEGVIVGRGMAEYSSSDLRQVKRMRRDAIAAVRPDLTDSVVVHRDRLIVL